MPNSLAELKVLLVGPIPPPAGGMANQTRQLGVLLRQSGAVVSLVAVNRPYSPKFVGRIPLIRAFFRLIPYFFDLYRQIRHADVVHLMANSGWSWHLFAAPAVWTAHWLDKPILVNYRGGHAEPFFAKSWKVVNASLKRASHIIVPSPYLQDVFAEYQKVAEVVPNVLDETLFFPNESTQRPNTDTDSPIRLLVTRNLEPIYDIPSAIHCLASVMQVYPHTRLFIAGSGPEYQSLVNLTEKLGIANNVDFLGRLDSKRIAELYRESDFLLNPSTVDNSPNSVIEALACGVPVITTNVGGIPRLVQNEHDAFMVEPRQPELLASGVLTLMKDEQRRQTQIANGLTTAKQFYWSNVSLKLLNAYNTALETKRAD